METALLSVVIPTYNRYVYLKDALRTIASIPSERLEVIVHDNTERNEEILPLLGELNDPRIRYYHVAEHISVVENSDLAVQYATGEYVCMIGDDDTICESMLSAAAFCHENGIDACMFPFPGFNWVDMTFEKTEKEPNLFFLHDADGSVEPLNPMEILRNTLRMALGLPHGMPRIYHGMVSKACLDRVRKRCGTYFPGPSPDMANATAVCLEARTCVYISDYLMVSGYGYKSARGEGNRQAHYGKISEKPWLPKDTEKYWDKDIPQIFSGETIFAQSLLRSLHLMGRDDLAKEYNYGRLYASFLARHQNSAGYMLRFCAARPYRGVWMLRGILSKLAERARRGKFIQPYHLTEENVSTLSDAQKYTDAVRTQKGLSEYYWKQEI